VCGRHVRSQCSIVHAKQDRRWPTNFTDGRHAKRMATNRYEDVRESEPPQRKNKQPQRQSGLLQKVSGHPKRAPRIAEANAETIPDPNLTAALGLKLWLAMSIPGTMVCVARGPATKERECTMDRAHLKSSMPYPKLSSSHSSTCTGCAMAKASHAS
jgi:hypothetical protein